MGTGFDGYFAVRDTFDYHARGRAPVEAITTGPASYSAMNTSDYVKDSMARPKPVTNTVSYDSGTSRLTMGYSSSASTALLGMQAARFLETQPGVDGLGKVVDISRQSKFTPRDRGIEQLLHQRAA